VDAAEPSIAAANDGTIYVTWVEHAAKMQADIMLMKLDGNGKPAYAPVRVNPRAGEASAWRGDPPTIATAADGTVYIGWTGRTATEGHATNIFLSASRDGGRTFESPVKVNDDAGEVVHGMHSMAVDERGRVFMAWLDERNVKMEMPDEKGKMDEHKMEANREVFAATSSDGGRTFSQNRLVAREACPCCKTALAVGPEGRLYVGWRQVLPHDFRHIAVASSSAAGQLPTHSRLFINRRWPNLFGTRHSFGRQMDDCRLSRLWPRNGHNHRQRASCALVLRRRSWLARSLLVSVE
jgi:hypothetical protein